VEKNSGDRNLLGRYLLCQLPEEDRTRLEESYLTDDLIFERLLVTEDELIDDYVRGELNENERKHFEHRYVTDAGRYERVKFALALMMIMDEKAKASAVSSPVSKWIALWKSLLSLLSRKRT
jgi:hypothetical protein